MLANLNRIISAASARIDAPKLGAIRSPEPGEVTPRARQIEVDPAVWVRFGVILELDERPGTRHPDDTSWRIGPAPKPAPLPLAWGSCRQGAATRHGAQS